MTIQQNLLSSGTVNWISTSTGTGGTAVGIDASKNIYSSQSNATAKTAWIIKRDSFGAYQWASGVNNFLFGSTIVDSSNNAYLIGYEVSTNPSGSALYVAKYNSSGTFQWGRSYADATAYVQGKGVSKDSSDNIYAVGTNTNGVRAGWVTKFNSSGTLQWQKKFTDTSGNAGTTIFYASATDSLSNVYVVGSSQDRASTTAYTSGVIAKYDSSGTLQWKKNLYESSNTGDLAFFSIAIDLNDNIYVQGNSYAGAILVKYNTSGVVQFQKKYTVTSGLSLNFSNQISVENNDKIYVGTVRGGIICFDSSGSIVWNSYFVNSNGTIFGSVNVQFSSPSNIIVGSNVNTGSETNFVSQLPNSPIKFGTYTLGSYTIVYNTGNYEGAITVASTSFTEGTTSLTETTPTNTASSLSLNTTISSITNYTTLI